MGRISLSLGMKAPPLVFLVLCLFGLQEFAYLFISSAGLDYVLPIHKLVGASLFRLFIELQVSFVLAVLPAPLLIFLLLPIYLFLVSAVILFCESGLLLTPSLLLSNFREGATVVNSMGISLGGRSLLYVVLSGALFAASIYLSVRKARIAHSRVLAIALLVVLLLDVGYARVIDPPSKIKNFVSNARIMLSYGYLGFVVIEARYVAFADHQRHYLNLLNSMDFEGLKASPEPMRRPSSIYMIQWESFGTSALSHLDHNTLIKRLASPGVQTLRVEHRNGSADTDYSINTGLPTARSINSYLLSPTGREYYLPREMTKIGYTPTFVHCNSGKFFSRNRRIGEFGYQRVFWADSFSVDARQIQFWGLNDQDCANQIINKTGLQTGQFMYFVTLTSHYPYRNIPESNKLGDINKRYFSEIKYTSLAIESLMDKMPTGSLVLIFGDHRPVGVGENERIQDVPLICAEKKAETFESCSLGQEAIIDVWDFPRLLISNLPPQE